MGTFISEVPAAIEPSKSRKTGDLSYKFQRLRERLRQSVLTGELTGKLPGERVLAKRYNCNAKTLSKALTDLAAEGLLDRSIGRGTYVRGSEPAEEGQGPWLILGEGQGLESGYLREFTRHNPRCQLVVGEPQQRPSYVNQFKGVIDVSYSTPDSFLRDLVVRGIPVVVVGREPRTYSLDSVLIDLHQGAVRLSRELLQQGHRRFVAVEAAGRSMLAENLRQSVSKPGLNATVDAVGPSEVLTAVENGATALVCDGEEVAATVLKRLAEAGIAVPGRVSVVAVGVTGTAEQTETPNGAGNGVSLDATLARSGSASVAVTGCYVPMVEMVENASRLLADTQPRRPATLWLAPIYVSRGTVGPASDSYNITGDPFADVIGAS